MENNPTTDYSKLGSEHSLYIDPSIEGFFPFSPDEQELLQPQRDKAFYALIKSQRNLQLHAGNEIVLELPENSTNLAFCFHFVTQDLLNHRSQYQSTSQDIMVDLTRLNAKLIDWTFFETIQQTANLRNLLQILSQKIDSTSTASIMIHFKGESKATVVSSNPSSEGLSSEIPLNVYNQLSSAIKKSKSKIFGTQTFKKIPFSFIGSFLGHISEHKTFNAIILIGRGEFLNFTSEEIESFQLLCQMMDLVWEKAIRLEFDQRHSTEILQIFEHAPFNYQIKNQSRRLIAQNRPVLIESNSLRLPHGHEFSIDLLSSKEDSQISSIQDHKIKLLGDLFNTIRHELSNPLFGLSLSSDLLLNDSHFNNEDRFFLQEIKKNIERSQLLIQNLSKLYAMDEGYSCGSIQKILDEAYTLAKSELKQVKKKIYNTQNLVLDQIEIEGRPLFIIQIIFNLLVNSVEAMKKSSTPEVSIFIMRDGESLTLDISDNGPGLPALVKENLFRPFTTTKLKGHGLGLVLSRHLALKIGGDLVYIEQDIGTCFRLKLKIKV